MNITANYAKVIKVHTIALASFDVMIMLNFDSKPC